MVNLSKYYGTYAAVKNLNLAIYKGEITILLGCNGAGKSTTIALLTGLLHPTGGSVLIDGRNMKTDFERIRNKLGICLQDNILFPDLTIQDHFYFFARLKRLSGKEVKCEVEEFLNLLDFQDNVSVLCTLHSIVKVTRRETKWCKIFLEG